MCDLILFSVEGAPQFTKLLKWLCPANSPIMHRRLVQDQTILKQKKSGKNRPFFNCVIPGQYKDYFFDQKYL